MSTTKLSQWSREERDRVVTKESLWYELDALQHRFDTKLILLGRKGERAARYPDEGRGHPIFDGTTIFMVVVVALIWAALVVLLILGARGK